MSFGRGRRHIEDFITNLLSKGDGSVFEHVNYGFVITGVSRSLTHELVRHRAGFAYSQRSQRFVDESDSPFVVPPAISEGGGEDSGGILKDALEKAAGSYTGAGGRPREEHSRADRRRGGPPGRIHHSPGTAGRPVRQAARAVLPNATETKIFVTANVRAWRHFIEMRGAVLRRLGDTTARPRHPRDTQGRGPAPVRRLHRRKAARRHQHRDPQVLEGLAGCGLLETHKGTLATSAAALPFLSEWLETDPPDSPAASVRPTLLCSLQEPILP